MEKRESVLRRKKEDFILNRILLWFGSAVVLEFFLLLVNRYYLNYRSDEINIMAALHSGLYILIFVGAAFFAVSAIWTIMTWRQGKGVLVPVALTGFSLAVGICSFFARFYKAPGMQLLQMLVPMIAVLALIYYLYQREFFCITAVSGLNIFGLWLCRKADGNHITYAYAYTVVFAVVLVVVLACTKRASANHGVLTLGGRDVRLFGANASYPAMYLTCGVAAVSMVVALVLGAMAAYFALFTVVAWLFALAVFHTVKLM